MQCKGFCGECPLEKLFESLKWRRNVTVSKKLSLQVCHLRERRVPAYWVTLGTLLRILLIVLFTPFGAKSNVPYG